MTPENRVTPAMLKTMKQRGEKIVVLTAYDASFTAHLEAAGVDVILVGDSLGMVLQGHDSTLPVTMQDMAYHTRMVARGIQRGYLVADLPYHSYQDVRQAEDNARQLLAAGAEMVKLEGGKAILEIARHLVDQGIPVCGHLGLLPQSVEELGGYKVQGREAAAAEQMLQDARALEQAGAGLIVLECIPAELAKRISLSLEIPTIGIGAGVDCDGQVLVLYDLLGITPGKRPRFSRDFLRRLPEGKGVTDAIKAYAEEVRQGRFPSEAETFH